MIDVAIVDYGAGNLTSVRQAIAACGGAPRLATAPLECAGSRLVVVPGVGHFRTVATALDSPWRDAVRAHVDGGGAVLGICLGMQWMFDGSDEAPGAPGMGLIAGTVARIPASVKVPHVGWNTLELAAGRRGRLLDGLPDGTAMYFTHSYAAPEGDAVVATTTHGIRFAAAIERGLIFGTQFHPEKSGDAGLRLIANVIRASRETY